MRSKLCLSVVRVIVVFVGALLCASAFGQSESPAPPLPAKLRFLFLDESAGYYMLKVGEKSFRQISANPYEISSPYQPPQPPRGAGVSSSPLEIFKTVAGIDPVTGRQRQVKIATVIPPTNTPSALVVVTPRSPAAPDAPLDFKVEIIDCNPAEFPARSIRIVNRGRVPMAAAFGSERTTTQPGESHVVRPSVDSRDRVFYKIAAQEAGGWKLLTDNITVLRPTTRLFGIFVFSPNGMRHTRTAEEIAEFGPPPPGHFWLTFSDSI